MTCDCPNPGPPTLAGFLNFVRSTMGITAPQLPDNSPWLALSYCTAKALVLIDLACASPLLYQQAVYNLGGSNLINFAQDPTPIVPYMPNDPNLGKLGFFAYTRASYNTLGFVSGIIQAAADETTSESMVVPESFKNWTLANLQQAKDPYGRYYISIASDYGPAVWGLS